MSARLDFRCWVASDTGRIRANNEDAIALPGLEDAQPRTWSKQLPREAWAFVADGLGGHSAGEVASELTVAMLTAVAGMLRTREQVQGALQGINLELNSLMERSDEFEGMGTTIAGIMLGDEECLAFNLGDSRIYLLSNGRLQQISRDHHDGKYLTGFLGGSSFELVRLPHFATLQVSAGDRLLLCTDGLTNMVSDVEIEAILMRYEAEPALALVETALEAGGHDNVSVIVIAVEKGTHE